MGYRSPFDLPHQWNRLYELLPNKRRAGNGWEPSLPLLLAAWDETPAIAKVLRLKEHIESLGTGQIPTERLHSTAFQISQLER
jgi:hypothetical protein